MERLPIGSITFHSVPYPDGSGEKRRPALVLDKVNDVEYFLLEITSQPRMFTHGILIDQPDFEWGRLNEPSQVRCDRILTANETLLRAPECQLKMETFKVIVEKVISLLPKI